MERKKFLAHLFLSFVCVIAFAMVNSTIERDSYVDVQGENEKYLLNFDADKNKLAVGPYSGSTYSGSGTAMTELGNSISFNYNSLYNPSSIWQTIKSGGFITNTQPIHGMSMILLSKFSTSTSFRIYWSNTTTFSEDRYEFFSTSSPLTVRCDFDGYLPNYIKILAITNAEIINGFIEFYCVNHYKTLTVSANESYRGAVAGGGLYLPGTSVSISAAAYNGNTFVGWYQAETFVSANNPFTFSMPNDDVSYTAVFTPNDYDLIVLSSDTNKGTVSGGGTYTYGSYVTVTASSSEGYALLGWYQGSTLKSTNVVYSFMMPYNTLTLTALFVNEYTVSIWSTDEGLGGVSGGGDYASGASVTILATPVEGIYFKAWYNSLDQVVSRTASYTFTMPEQNVSYYATFSTLLPLETGDVHLFGTYPQSLVRGDFLKSSLTTAAGTLPSSENAQLWTDYGYYIHGEVTSFMWYIDIDFESEKYRGVYYTDYRPPHTSEFPISYGEQNANGYPTGYVYWFKYEPIAWRVLEVDNEYVFLMANLVMDSQDYYYSTAERTLNEVTIYANNYEYSHVRTWLNDQFYNAAFTVDEKNKIQATVVDNSPASTASTTNQYACNNTTDHVFLLSYTEVNQTDYGFTSNTSRLLEPSDYALAQGVMWEETSGWLLRSPYDNSQNISYSVADIEYLGGNNVSSVHSTFNGIVPAIWISIAE